MNSSGVDVAVLGAGLTGLSAALALEARGANYRAFDRAPEPGGLARTREEAGFRFDHTGHVLHLKAEKLRQKVESWLDGEFLELTRRSVIWSHGVYTPYPFQANTHGLPAHVAYECVMGFLEAHSRPSGAPKNFAEYCLANFGEGFSRHFMLPYNSRLWGVPAEEIGIEWCDRFVPRPGLEDVIAGAVGHSRRALGYNTTFLYPPQGIGQLPIGMARGVTALALGRAPVAIDAVARKLVFADETVPYKALLSSIPLVDLIDLLQSCPESVQDARKKLRQTPLYYLDVALNCPAQKEFHWAYVPEARYPFYRVGCYSNFSQRMAPPGGGCLYVELADRRSPNLDQLLPEVTQGLLSLGLIQAEGDVRFARLRRIECAYVLFTPERAEALATIQQFLAEHEILSTGRYGNWTYASMEDALHDGEAAVIALEARL